MSRQIPRLRPWRVTLYRTDDTKASVTVGAINRRFALWNAEEDLGPFYWVKETTLRVTAHPCGRA